MAKPKVFVARRIPEAGINLLRDQCEVDLWDSDMPPPRSELLARTKDCDGVLPLLTDKIDAEFLDNAPKVKVVANLAVGFDNIDVPECTRRGVVAANTPGVLTETTADFAWALMMATARRIPEGVEYVKEGKWKTWGPLLLMGQDLHHATLGLIGLGRIGIEVAKRAKGFDMRIVYYDVYRREDIEQSMGITYVDMDTLLKEADFISVHTPLTNDTYHLLSGPQFAKMKSTAVLVNTARGGVIDMDALYNALKDGQIWAAGLDVTEPEPIPMDSPLLKLDNCAIVPHIASASVATRTRMSTMAAENILAVFNGQRPPAILNPEVLKKS
ncbi:MAG: 2-hydroxyacid dehydrogenase [Chloroflexota bacterium]